MDRTALGLLAVAHLVDDANQGAVPVMLPYFMTAYELSYSSAAVLMLAVTVASSVLQPLLGQFSDRHSAPWLLPLGILFAGGGVAMSVLMPNYALIVFAIGLTGIGVAAFHPEAARFANYASGQQRAMGMSIFSIGGNFGFAAGPAIATPLMLIFGLQGGVFLVIPAALMSLILLWQLPRFRAHAKAKAVQKAAGRDKVGKDAWGAFGILTGALVARSVLFYGMNTFTPLYFQHGLNESVAVAGLAVTILFACGGAGTLLGGWLADRYGRKRVVVGGLVAVTVFLAIFVNVHDPTLATLLLVPIGLAMFAPTSVMVVLGQDYLPNRVGTASGMTLGLSVSIGGFAAPLLGQIGDQYGIHAVMVVLTVFPAVAAAFAAVLPRPVHSSA